VLLNDGGTPKPARRLLVAADLFAAVSAPVAAALEEPVRKVAAVVGEAARTNVLEGCGIDGLAVFRTLQGWEAWAAHGDWIGRTSPSFGPGVRERFALAAAVSPEQAVEATAERERFAAHVAGIVQDGAVLCLPTAPGIAPLKTATLGELDEFRARALALLSVAGLARLPQVNLPLGSLEGCPLGLSIIGSGGADATLLALAGQIMR